MERALFGQFPILLGLAKPSLSSSSKESESQLLSDSLGRMPGR